MNVLCTSESLGAVLRALSPCRLVWQALKYILRGVWIGADRIKISFFEGWGMGTCHQVL